MYLKNMKYIAYMREAYIYKFFLSLMVPQVCILILVSIAQSGYDTV